MNSKNLLIINIGRFFVFASWLSFTKKQGFKVKDKYYFRYPEFININDSIKYFINSIEFEGEIICLVDEKKALDQLQYNSILKLTKYWKKNFKYLHKELEIPETTFISIDYGRLRLISSDDYLERIDLSLNKVLKTAVFKQILIDLSLSYEDILNFINKGLPLPQQISDYYKSFILSFAYGKILGRSLDLKGAEFLIIESELFKSGFLDKSALINGISLVNKNIKYYSFDILSIWQVLLNDTLNEFSELKYLNQEVFQPEFTVGFDLHKNNKGKFKLIDAESDNKNEYNFLGDIQGFINLKDISISEDLDYQIFGNFLNINTSFKFSKLDIDKFKYWYRYYQLEDRKYFESSFSDNGKYEIVVRDSDIDAMENPSMYDYVYYDIFRYFPEGKYNILKIPGEEVDIGDVILSKEKLSKIIIHEVKSKHKGIIDHIDKDKGWVVIKVEKSKEKRRQSRYKVDYKHIRNLNIKDSLIEIKGYRLDCVLSFGEKRIGRLKKYDTKNHKDCYQSIVWIENKEELFDLIDNLEILQPKGIIVSNLNRSELFKVLGEDMRNERIFSLASINGYGEKGFSSKEIKKLLINEGKVVFMDPEKNGIYIVNKKGKFGIEQDSHLTNEYIQIFTFLDWNLKGDMIYNDEDSVVFRDYDNKIVDVANYNLIKFNER